MASQFKGGSNESPAERFHVDRADDRRGDHRHPRSGRAAGVSGLHDSCARDGAHRFSCRGEEHDHRKHAKQPGHHVGQSPGRDDRGERPSNRRHARRYDGRHPDRSGPVSRLEKSERGALDGHAASGRGSGRHVVHAAPCRTKGACRATKSRPALVSVALPNLPARGWRVHPACILANGDSVRLHARHQFIQRIFRAAHVRRRSGDGRLHHHL